ncbi:glycoside hydrolase family 47 protein [Thozetella sp. PMI_491]|nr:glycoside hydrolase family 47 protein [Thozetella sp. PMI_491]
MASPYQKEPISARCTPGKVITYQTQSDRAAAVKQVFQTSWDGYHANAFPHDTLLPVTNGYKDDRQGWAASAVDALSTALIMENWDAVNVAMDFIANNNWHTSVGDISLFETTIRYLGGMLSAYDLLMGPLKDKYNGPIDPARILAVTKVLADNLKVAFDTPSGFPDNGVAYWPPHRVGSTTNSIATGGTLVLEWTRLSDLTGDPVYGQLAQKAMQYLLRPQPASAEPFPGLIGNDVDINTGQIRNSDGGWVAGSDSFYEYLLKMYLYDPNRFVEYRSRWVAAADSSIQYLTSHPSSRPNLTFLAQYNGQTLRFNGQHLGCFAGGSFILGGLTLNEKSYIDYGLKLTEGCRATYAATSTGIGPDSFEWQDSKISSSGPPSDQASFYQNSGFWMAASNYVLRPEVVESYYYAYRATGDSKYQDWAWEAFQAISNTTHVGSGYSSIRNVNQPGGGGFDNFQESFWFAEVLKYCYLIFAPDASWQVQPNHQNQFVFNTEAHPIRIFGGNEKLVGCVEKL